MLLQKNMNSQRLTRVIIEVDVLAVCSEKCWIVMVLGGGFFMKNQAVPCLYHRYSLPLGGTEKHTKVVAENTILVLARDDFED